MELLFKNPGVVYLDLVVDLFSIFLNNLGSDCHSCCTCLHSFQQYDETEGEAEGEGRG